MTKRLTVLVLAVAVLASGTLAFAATTFRDALVFAEGFTVASGGTTYASITSAGIVAAANYRKTNGTTLSAADPNPSRATLRAASFFLVDTSSNAVDLDFSNDADLEAADLGTEWVFVVSAGGTNALTVTNGGSGVVVTTLNTLGTSCEDVGDYVRCVATALEAVTCVTVCADS